MEYKKNVLKQTVKILMRRLIRNRLIRISNVCRCLSKFTWSPKWTDFIYPGGLGCCPIFVMVIQCFVLVMEYIRGSSAPECILHNEHKTLYNLFSPDPGVSCVADTQASHREIYIQGSSNKFWQWSYITETVIEIKILLPIACGHGCCLFMFEIWVFIMTWSYAIQICRQHCESPWPRKIAFLTKFCWG